MKTKKAKPKKRRSPETPKRCMLIQWEELCTVDGKPVCPRCHEPAEMVLGFVGNPCWAHK